MKLKLFSAACILALLSVPSLAADSVTVVSWGGAYQDSVRKAFFEPFMKESGDNRSSSRWAMPPVIGATSWPMRVSRTVKPRNS